LTQARFYVSAETFHGFDHQALGQELGFEHFIGLRELSQIARRAPEPVAQVPVDANDIFTLCWTSGTEAEPKGCPMSHNNWQYMTSLMFTTCGLQQGDRILCVAPLVNMTAVGVNYVPWLAVAGTLVLHHPITPEILLRQLTGERIQYTILVPAMLNMIVKLPNVDQLDLSSVRTITTGSAPPSAWSLQEFKRRWNIEIVNIWGQNEGTALVAGPADVPDLDKRVDHLPWWGKQGIQWPSGVKGIELKLLGDEDEEITQPGGIGELCYRSPGVFAGYFQRPDLTARSFTADGFFRTGDLGYYDQEGYFFMVDRLKRMINASGFKVWPSEVENLMYRHPAIRECCVISAPDPRRGETVKACVVLREDQVGKVSEQDIIHWCHEEMAAYKVPARVEFMETLPRSPTGKLQWRALQDQEWARQANAETPRIEFPRARRASADMCRWTQFPLVSCDDGQGGDTGSLLVSSATCVGSCHAAISNSKGQIRR